MERSLLINSFVCSLFLLNFSQGAVFPPIETKCPPDCSAVSCLKPTCKGGLFTPECECCPKCFSQQGEKCGVPEKTYGKCDINLYCEKPAGSNQGLCAACPLFKCKSCDNGYELDARGCRTCKCKCPISSCLFIKCAYGVIKTTDVNGCEQCSCKPPPKCPTSSCLFIKCGNGIIKTIDANGCEQCRCKPPKCPEISNCALIRCGYGVTKGLDKNGCEFCTCDPPKGLFCPLYPAPPAGNKLEKCGLESFPCPKNECESDAECPYGKKCCVSGGVQGSPLKCITPVPFPIGK